MDSQTDSNFFSNFFRPEYREEIISSKIPLCAKYEDFYNLTHENRGVALIFNHEFFDDKQNKPREGTKKDLDRLTKVLTKLEFDIRSYNDLKFGEIRDIIKKVSKEDHSKSDCLLVCVMSHGDEGKIYAKDHAYPPDILWDNFTGDECRTLAGKPKMFFIQACRGSMIDEGALVKHRIEADSRAYTPEETYIIPAMADILVMYATYNGYYSWRSPAYGSWFIQSLCEELETRGECENLLTLLTFVNRNVAISYKSHVPANRDMHEKKQVCTIVSMLTRLMAFPKKNKSTEKIELDSVPGKNKVDNKEFDENEEMGYSS